MILFRLLVFNTLNHVVIDYGHVSDVQGIAIQKLVEGFAETERNAHYEIGTLILSKELIKKEHSYYQKEHSYYQKEHSYY